MAWPPATAREAVLERSSRCPSVALAIISGREVDDVRPRIGALRAIIAGSHGLECQDADGRMLWTARSALPPLPDDLARDLQSGGMHIEQKKFSVAVHFRHSDGAGNRNRLHDFTRRARSHRLQLMPGRKVVEARLSGGGKRAALRAIAAHVHASRVVYAGDDTTDFAALAFSAERGRAIFMESEERTPPPIASLCMAQSMEDLCCFFTCEIVDLGPSAVAALLPAGEADLGTFHID